MALVGVSLLSGPPVRERFVYTQKNLPAAAATGNENAVQFILDLGRKVDYKDHLGETALMKASQNGHIAIVKLLLVHGADVRERNQFGQTALRIAQAKGHSDIAELLKQAGATE
jgi:ankyrin repeat protein